MNTIFQYPLTQFDWFAVFAFSLGALWGLRRGLVRELMSIFAWILSFLIAPVMYKTAGSLIPVLDLTQSMRNAAGYVIVFVCVLIAATILSTLVRLIIVSLGLGLLDRILGAVFGVLSAGAVLLVMTMCINLSPFKTNPEWTHSNLAPVLQNVLNQVIPVVSLYLGRLIN